MPSPAVCFFSVIIPTFNRHKQTLEALNSVLKQSFPVHAFEVIVVDDGSDVPFLFKSVGNDPYITNNLRIIYNKKNKGVSFARNLGVKASRGSFIAFLDSDDVWSPDHLSKFYTIIKEKKVKAIQCQEAWYRNGKWINPGKKHLKTDRNLFSKSLYRCMVTMSSFAIDKDLFVELNGFDEKLRVCEDYALFLKVSAIEKIFLVDEKLSIRYAGHKDQLSFAYPAMDRYRVYGLLTVLLFLFNKDNNNEICDFQFNLKTLRTIVMIKRKIRILSNGSLNRKNISGIIKYYFCYPLILSIYLKLFKLRQYFKN